MIEVWSDGACDPNPGPGGWGTIVILESGEQIELSGGETHTTNNRMELIAAIEGLQHFSTPQEISLYSDSQYVITGAKVWIHSWQRNGWRTANKKPVKNIDLWQRIYQLHSLHKVEYNWVKGHSGVALNEQADRLAASAIPFSKS